MELSALLLVFRKSVDVRRLDEIDDAFCSHSCWVLTDTVYNHAVRLCTMSVVLFAATARYKTINHKAIFAVVTIHLCGLFVTGGCH